MSTKNSFFFTREEDDTKVVYRLKNAWIPFVFAWVGIGAAAIWFLAQPPLQTIGKVAFWIAVAFLLFRWICFFSANREMLSAKYSGRMKVEGSKFSKSNPPVITIQKKGTSPTNESSTRDESEWENIISSLCRELNELRRTWFEKSITMLHRTDAPLVNCRLEGRGECAMKAFQLYLVSFFIAIKRYVPREHARYFMDTLYPIAWGSQNEICLPLYQRYLELAGSDPRKAGDLCVEDLVQHVSDRDPGKLEQNDPEAKLLISGAFNMLSGGFVADTLISVARTFADDQTAKELEVEIQSILKAFGGQDA